MSNISVFEYPSDLQSTQKVSNDVDFILDRENVTREERLPFVLSISEAFTNAVIHGNKRSPRKKVKVKITVNEKILSADIEDEGEGGLDRIRQRKPPTQFDEGGRGINLIEHYATSVGYAETPTGGLKVEISFERKTNTVTKK